MRNTLKKNRVQQLKELATSHRYLTQQTENQTKTPPLLINPLIYSHTNIYLFIFPLIAK